MKAAPVASDGRRPAAWRVFAGVRVPRGIAVQLLAVARSVAGTEAVIRWVDPADVHVTLWFIGSIEVRDLPRLGDELAAAAAACRPGTLRIAGTGTFGRGRGRATWVGLEGPGARRLTTLAGTLRPGPFRAHVTLARGAPPGLATVLAAALAPPASGSLRLAWRATRLELLRSRQGTHPAYETIASFRLGGRPAPRSHGGPGPLLASRR